MVLSGSCRTGGVPSRAVDDDAEVTDAERSEAASARAVLADLRRARRRRRTRDFDPFEALYRVYITAVVTGVAVWLLSGVTGDTRVGAGEAARVTAHGPQVVGLVVAVALAVGLRSGGRGGPLVIEAADVRHVLLSPLDRAVALRPVAVRLVRFGALAGAGVGAVAGLLAYRRLPGGFPAWIVCGAAVGLLAAAGALCLAMLVSGHRLGRIAGAGLALVVVAWSAADLALGITTSPATLIGDVALWPLHWRPLGLVGVAVLAVAAVAGFLGVAGTSIEAAEARSTLVGQIRFAATLRDLRTVVVLRRQLSQELPRQRPWVRLPRTVRPGAASVGRARGLPVWRRGWHGILRFPAVRFGRMAVLSAAAGAALVGAWRGTTPLLLAAAACLYVAALDAVEPLAQEVDHPDRRDEYTVPAGTLAIRQLGPSAVLMVVLCLVGWGVAVAITGGQTVAVQVGAVMVLPAGLAAAVGAAVSVVQGAPGTFSATDSLLPPEAAGARAILRILLPPVIVAVGLLPLLAARSPVAHETPLQAATAVEPFVLLVVVAVGAWLRSREQLRAWWKSAMEEAGAQRKQPGRAG
jgi:hypothetical protein